MTYTITPLNVLFLLFAIKAIYSFATSQNADGLGGTGLFFALIIAVLGLLLDLVLQKFITDNKWMMIVESVLAAGLITYAFMKGMF